MARPTIKKGMSGKKGTDIGEAILLWRAYLGKPELKPAPGTTVYDFGAATDKATREWQKSVGLPVNGIVDDAAWARYDQKIAAAPAVVQAKAAAVETQGEANKAAAMAAAVQGKAAPAPGATTPIAKAKAAVATAKAKTQAVKDKVKEVAVQTKAKTDNLSPWARIVGAGAAVVGGLIGWKALSQRRPR